jgi:hypothetical protein
VKQPQELAWWSASQLAAAEARVHEAWTQWHQAWLGALVPGARVGCVNAHEAALPVAGWHALAEQPGRWIADANAARELLAMELTGEAHPAHASVGAQLVATAWDALRACLLALFPGGEGEVGAPEARLLQPWSGAIALQLPLGAAGISVLLDARGAAHLIPAARGARAALPALHPLDSAARSGTARLSVELSECEISLGDLHGLAVGDVLRLDHELTRPLTLRLDGATLCSARLGRRGIAKAVALAPLSEALGA